MPRLSSVGRLPQSVRAKIDSRLIDNGFGDYIAIAEDLRAQGFKKISKSALARYGKELKSRVQLGRAQEQLAEAGVNAKLASELLGNVTQVVVIDRRNGRARLVNLHMQVVDVIKLLKGEAK